MRAAIIATVAAVALVVVVRPLAANEAAAADKVRAAVKELDAKLKSYPTGEAWRSYLNWNSLTAQIESKQPDRIVLLGQWKRFSQPGTELDRPEFAAVRRALEAWIDAIGLPPFDRLPALIDAARAHPLVPTAAGKQARRGELERTTSALDVALGKYGATGRGWRSFLRLDALKLQLDQSKEPDPAVLEQVYQRFAEGASDWDLPAYAAARRALASYLPVALVAADADFPAHYRQTLDQLADVVKKWISMPGGHPPTSAGRDQLGQLMSWLEMREQAPAIVDLLRGYEVRPNLRLQFSHALIARQVDGSFDELAPIDEVVLGSTVRGTSRTVGKTALFFVPESRRAAIDWKMVGRARSLTTGYPNRAVVESQTMTELSGEKRIELTGSGLYLLPTRAKATAVTTLTSVSAGGGSYDAIARDRVNQTRPESERVSAQHTEENVRHALDRNARNMLSDALGPGVRLGELPLAWRGRYFPKLDFSTTREHLLVEARQATPEQLTTASRPSASLSGDLIVEVHESLVGNRTRSLLGGRTFDQESLSKALVRVGFGCFGRPRLNPPGNDAAWNITFVDDHPITVRLAGDACTISVRGRRFVVDEEILPAMDISAEYRLELADKQPQFRLVGKLLIYPPGFIPGSGQRLGGRYQALRRTLTKRLTPMFPPVLLIDAARQSWLARNASLDATTAQARDGWLMIAYSQSKSSHPLASNHPQPAADSAPRPDVR